MEDSWKDFVNEIEKYGFEIVVRRKFSYSRNPGWTMVYPEFLIAAHRQKHLLLCASSYVYSNGDEFDEIVNGVNVYGTLNSSRELTEEQRSALENCSDRPGIFGREFNLSFKKNLVFSLEQLDKAFGFIKWNDPDRFLRLLDYSQKSESWKLARNIFLASAPKWVKDFILPDRAHRLALKLKGF